MRIATILTLLFLFIDLGLNGQSRIITGRVVSEDLEALPTVNIENSEELLLAMTDFDGRFKISIPKETDKLIFRWIGMELTEIKLNDKCDTVEVIMLYAGTYDYMSLGKVDRLRKKRFDNIPSLHSDAVRNGLFINNNICYERIFVTLKPNKLILDSLRKVNKFKRNQIKDTFKGLALSDTIRIPFSESWREDGTDRTTLHFYSNGNDGEDFDCSIRVKIIDKNKRKGEYNLVCRVIDRKDCNYNIIVLGGTELKVGATFDFNMKYYKILNNK